jgi:3-oxoacyl-(acyl-carrier-protein) synthase
MMMLMEWNANSCTQPSFPYEFCLQRLAGQRGHVARFSRPFDQVRSGARMAQIGRAVVILQKKNLLFFENQLVL